ncbi:A/G-specific adenine glycosylase [Buchnera aphidicola]|uniref:A/G-specific adenine glycosylase n=1 Tax=Buchnera aphidicola TaxID=9 RepID=UPI003463E63A
MKNWEIAQKIINWKHCYGRNKLPWQKKKPYFIWISEIMLQQTSVTTVIPYFNRFIKKFKNVYDLYNSDLNEILHIWSGLGYYKRAYNIHQSSKIIIKKHNGHIPDNMKHLTQLPGIGKTTAGAILSLSYNFSFSILDGNIKRILTRLYNIDINLKKSIIQKKLWKLINQITPIHHANKFNQGMMDLGQLICKYKKPKCIICPIKSICQYHMSHEKNHISLKIMNQKKIHKHFIIIVNNQKILLEQRKSYKIWKYLFSFPEFDNLQDMKIWIKKRKIKNIVYQKYYYEIQKFSNFILHMKCILVSCQNKKISYPKKNHIWYNLKNKQHVGIPKAIKEILLKINHKK